MAQNKSTRLADIYKAEKSQGGGVASTFGKAALEKIDPRNVFNQQGFLAAALPALFKAYRAPTNVKNSKISDSPSQIDSAMFDEMFVNMRIVAKESLNLSRIAFDINIMKQNTAILVKSVKESPATSGDKFFKKESARDKEYKSKFKKQNTTPSTKPTAAGKGGAASLKDIGLGALDKAMSGLGKGVGLAAIGLGIGGFITGLALGGAAVNALGGASGIKDLLVNLAEGLNAFDVSSLVFLGTLLGAGALFGVGLNGAIGMGAVGLGFGGFIAGLALGGAGVQLFGGAAGVKDLLVNLAEGLNALEPNSLIALGSLLGAGALFGATGLAGSAALGIGAVGVGLGAFLAALALSGTAVQLLGGSDGIKELLINLAGGLNPLSELNGTNLLKVGGALVALTAGLAALFGIKVITGIKEFFFGEDDPEKGPLAKLAKQLKLFKDIDGENLSKLGQGFKDLTSGLLGLAAMSDKDLAQAQKASGVAKTAASGAPAAGGGAPAAGGGAPAAGGGAPAAGGGAPATNKPTPYTGGSGSTAGGTSPSMSPTKDSQSGDEPSEELISNIKKLEGFSAKAFWDHKQYSIGYGTKANGKDEVIDEQEADRRLRATVKETRDKVVAYGKKHNYGFNSSQIDSLTSFAYNLGPGILDKVTDGGKRTISEIAEAIPKYNKASGEVNKGLEKRRNIELAMFNSNPSSGATTTLTSASPPSSGKALASASTSMSDQRMAAMKPGGGNTTINAPTTNVAQNGGGGGNNVSPPNVYDNDLVKTMFENYAIV